VYGSLLGAPYLDSVRVAVSCVDAGLPPGTPESSRFWVLRLDDQTGTWVFHQTGTVQSQTVRYSILVNGIYSVRLTGVVALDSSWTVTGFIGPGGGTLNLLSSRLIVPPGAVSNTVEVSFTIMEASPGGLPDALPRVYMFGPEGLTFANAVTLEVPYADAGDNGVSDRRMHLYYYDEGQDLWIRQSNQVNVTNEGYTVGLNHFSRYAFGR
jgi:hypothetical protein